jgi:hypothetical protein
MITRDLVWGKRIDAPHRFSLDGNPMPRAEGEAMIARFTSTGPHELVSAPCCTCCGVHWTISGEKPHFRCEKHVGRNPCGIEGCKCTTKAVPCLSIDEYLCSKHYRPLTTISERRTLARARRWHKKAEKRRDRAEMDRSAILWWRLLRRMVKHARRRSAGDIDMTEINKMFGWE